MLNMLCVDCIPKQNLSSLFFALQINLDNLDSVLGRYTSSCKVKLTVQRAAPPLAQIVNQHEGEDDQLLTPPSVAKIITGQVRVFF
jgi:hypothetical protein